jgi:gas vesicle protein
MSGNKHDRNEMNYSQDDDSIKMKDFIIGALIGGAVGAAAALFLTPKSGRDFRENLNDQATVLKDKTSQLRETAKNKGIEIAGIAKEKASGLTQYVNLQSKSQDGKSESSDNSEQETQYIPLNETAKKPLATFDDLTLKDDEEVRRKLEEAKKAFDEEEIKVKQ